jgi:hypothetical protein
MLALDSHDAALVARAQRAISEAVASAHMPPAVAKRLFALAARHRNKGRNAAIKRHPFKGKCEASGKALDRKNAHLDELQPELGYAGKVRWVCPKANNSGKFSCGDC